MSRFRLPAGPLSGNNLGQVVHTHMRHSSVARVRFLTGEKAEMSWEGNRWPAVAERLCGTDSDRLIVVYPLTGLSSTP